MWPELRIIWALLPLLAAVFVISYGSLPAFLNVIQGGLLLASGAAFFVGVYRTAQAERKNSAERSEFKNIIFNLEDALVVYDESFEILFFNPAAEKLFKTNSDLVLGRQLQPQDIEKPAFRLLVQIIFPSLAPSVVSRSKAGEYPQIVDLSFTEPTLELRVTTSPINDDSGKLLGFVKIIHDRTRELSLIKSKNEFLTVASHQLRTPVTDITWAVEELSKDATLNENSRSLVENTKIATRELLKIIEDLLNIARIEEGHFGYHFESADIVEFVNKILAQVAPIARKSGIKVYFDRPKESLPVVTIDFQKLSLALDNLLGNAIRYNVENGEVIVKVDKVLNQPFLEVSVKDTGIGIPADDISKLFGKFFRAENALKSQTAGSGLGLYIAKNIIQSHGGRVWAESELNRGSVFHFTLPTDPRLIPQHEVATE